MLTPASDIHVTALSHGVFHLVYGLKRTGLLDVFISYVSNSLAYVSSLRINYTTPFITAKDKSVNEVKILFYQYYPTFKHGTPNSLNILPCKRSYCYRNGS